MLLCVVQTLAKGPVVASDAIGKGRSGSGGIMLFGFCSRVEHRASPPAFALAHIFVLALRATSQAMSAANKWVFLNDTESVHTDF